MTGTLIPASRPTIDAGRYELQQQREKFRTLTATITGRYGMRVDLSNEDLLSPRRIYRAYLRDLGPRIGDPGELSKRSIAGFSILVSNIIFKLMQDWREEDYPAIALDDDEFSSRYNDWLVSLHEEVSDAR